MPWVPLIIAAFGLGVCVYAALETEIEDVRGRAAIGLIGLAMMVFGVLTL